MAKKDKKSKSPKPTGSNASEGKSKGKKGNTYKSQGSIVSEGKSSKPNKLSKGAKKKDDITTSIVNDDLWKCTVVMMVCPPFYDSLLLLLDELPNTAVINSKMFGRTKPKNDGGSRKSRSIATTKASKGSKKSTKTKASKKKENGKIKAVGDEENYCNINLEEEKSKVVQSCTSIKQLIVNLRNSDLGLNKTNKKADKPKNKTIEKNKNNEISLERKHTRNPEEACEDDNITHRFVILCGFYSLMFPEVMNSLLVPVKALITVRLSSSILNLAQQGKNLIDENETDSKIKRKHQSFDQSDNNYNLFLNNIRKSKRDLKYLEENKDVIFLNYSITDEDIAGKSIAANWKENMVKILNGIKHSWDAFNMFRDSLDILEVPLDETLKIEDAKLYNTMISMVPLECVSIPIIIHCMLDQVHDWVDEKDNSTSNSVRTSTSINTNSLNMNKYSHNSFNTSYHLRLHKITNISPILINATDYCKYNTFHLALPEFDFEKITSYLLSSSLIYKLWDSFPMLTPSQIKFNEFHLQRLQKFSTELYDNHKLYLIHFHHFTMNCFLLKLNEISSESENRNETDLNSLSTIGIYFDLKPVEDKYSNYFVRRIIRNIIQQVPQKALKIQNISTNESTDVSDVDDDDINKSYPTRKENLLYEKLLHKKEKLDKLESFIFHPDLLFEYKELRILEEEQSLTDVIKHYELIEELNTVTMCQSLNSALQAFENVNFLYSSITDSILLWFNNNININEIKTSYSIESSVETPIGFRDFYKFKLGGKTNLMGTVLKYESLFNDVSGSHNKIIDLQPLTVYNIGSLHLGVFESHSRFFSPDSSYVKVKRSNYFNKFKTSVSVSVGKNNTSLTYEFDPEDRKKNLELRMNLHNSAEIECSLSWNPYPQNIKDENVTVGSFSLNVDCNLNITLPSGLFIEVIRSNTVLGPYYIRQRYLSKGPTCSNIWDEKFRCYLKTGTIVIFYDNGSVDILYSNGTKVNRAIFEFKEICYTINTIEKEKGRDVSTKQNLDFSKSTNKSKTKKGEKKKNSSEKASSETKIKKNTVKIPKASVNIGKPELIEDSEKQQPPKVILNLSEHSVIAWDGLSTRYKNNVLQETNELLSLRMAFDSVNHELYIQRSDKLTSLYTSDNLTVTFPDGSRITSVVEDGKNLSFLNDFHIITLEARTSDSNRCTQSKSERSSAEVNSEMSNFDMEFDKEEPFVFVELSHLSEHCNYASVNYDNWMNEVEILLPDDVTVKLDAQGLFDIGGKDGERLNLKNHSLVFEANVLDHSLKQSKTVLYFENIDTTPTIQCHTEDSFGNIFSVDDHGRTNVLQVYWNINRRNTYYCPRYPQNAERLFVFNRDLTGYEMIHTIQQDSITSDKNVHVITTSIDSGFSDLFSLYAQSPVHKNRSEEYLMSYENNLPTLIRRQDLITPCRMPDHIWFLPALSTVMEAQQNEPIIQYKIPEAVKIRKLLKIKDGDKRIIVSFLNALKKYMVIGEEIYSRYVCFYPKDLRKVEIYNEGELQKENMFGCSSYYLSDDNTIINLVNKS